MNPVSDNRPAPAVPSPRIMKAAGAVLVVGGVLLMLIGAALLFLLLPHLDYTGPIRLATQGMFAAVAAVGLFGLLDGLYAVRNGRQHMALRVLTLGCAALFIALCYEFNSLHQALDAAR